MSLTSTAIRASACLVLLVASGACFWSGGDDWESVTVGGPDGCWEITYSSYWVVDEEFLRIGRPYEQCPFDTPSRNSDRADCDSMTGTVLRPLVLARGHSNDADPGATPPNVMAAVSSHQLPTPLEQATCVRTNGSIKADTEDHEPLEVTASEPFAWEIGGRDAACLDTAVPAQDSVRRICWFQVDEYTVRVQGGDYAREQELIDEFFRDVARSVYLDPGRSCEPRCDD